MAKGDSATSIMQDDKATLAPGQGASRGSGSARGVVPGQESGSIFDYGSRRGAGGIRVHGEDDVNLYARSNESRHGIDPRLRPTILLSLALVVVFVIACVMPTGIFDVGSRANHTIGGYAEEVGSAVQGLVYTLTGGESMYSVHFFTIVAALFAGAALGVSGCAYQGAMRNPLAGPSTLGISNGGTLGTIIFVVLILPYTTGSVDGTVADYNQAVGQLSTFGQIMQEFGTFIASLIGCGIVVITIMAIAFFAGRGRVSNASLVIAGQVFAAVIGVVIGWIYFYLANNGSSEQASILLLMETSTFTGTYDFRTILMFAVPVIVCIVVMCLMSSRLNLLAFNDAEARTMGISVSRTRNAMIALCTVLTALVISFCGPIGFVGFMVPHLARRMVGPDFRFLLPASAALGAILVVAVNMLTSLGIPGLVAGSTGVVTGLMGCAMFLAMAVRSKGARDGWL